MIAARRGFRWSRESARVKRERTTTMKLQDISAFVTGANRGLGRALVDALLERGARRVYAASRDGVAHPDRRVIAVRLDVTDAAQIRAAATAAPDVRLLI